MTNYNQYTNFVLEYYKRFIKHFLATSLTIGGILAIPAIFVKGYSDFCFKQGEFGLLVSFLITIIISFVSTNYSFRNSAFLGILYHNTVERERKGIDVKAKINSSNSEIFISGIVLLYIAKSCVNEMLNALNNGATITILICTETYSNEHLYERYTQDFSNRIKSSKKLFKEFYESLSPTNKTRFKLYETNLFLTHSIGLYDDHFFISQHCLDLDSSKSPSYFIDKISPLHKIFRREIDILVNDSVLILPIRKPND